MNKIVKLFCLALFCSVALGCSNDELPAGNIAEGFLLADPDQHKAVLNIMRDKGIPYEENDRGYIVYLLKDQAKVHGIERIVLYGRDLNETIFETASLVNDDTRQKYEAAFREKNIPYRISSDNGITHIIWSQKYGPRVDVIRQKVDDQIVNELVRGAKGTNR
jgi:hypothetical protein